MKAPNGQQEDDDEYVQVQDNREVEQQQAALGEDNEEIAAPIIAEQGQEPVVPGKKIDTKPQKA